MEYSVSTLKANSIQAATGTTVNLASGQTFKANTIAGTTTAGSITVQGEGTATTNLQQGLVKAWIHFNGTSNAILDSLNHSALTDNGTGNYTMNITNDMANVNYCATVNAKLWSLGSNEYRQTTVDTFAAGTIKVQSLEPYLGGGSADLRQVDGDSNCMQITGDLA